MAITARDPLTVKEGGSPLSVICEVKFCTFHVTARDQQDAQHALDIHKCPYLGGPTKMAWENVTKTLVEQMWEKLDREIDKIKDPNIISREYHQNRALAISECIVLFMKPFFEDTKSVSREALKRWKARQEGDTEYETVGLGHRRYEMASKYEAAAKGMYTSPHGGFTDNPAFAGDTKAKSAQRQSNGPAVTLSEEDQNSIKFAYAADPVAFSPEIMAPVYRVPVSQIKAILATA